MYFEGSTSGMLKIFNRLGNRVLNREGVVARDRKGHQLGRASRVGMLVPAANGSERRQLHDLAEALVAMEDVPHWKIVAYTGMTRKAHAKARAQRIQKMGEGVSAPPDFPQMSEVKCLWADDCGRLGLPAEGLMSLDDVDVLIFLDQHLQHLALKALLRRSKAPFKVGPIPSDDAALDFMLTWPDGGDMLSFVQLAFHYLKTLDLK